ncbi:MAG: AtpZ/AtpI family protein [Bacillus subtilis]|nr:AtpZ/AtpI family protein [Bacillus subtilis]
MAVGYFLGKWLDSLFFPDQSILIYVGFVLGIFAGLRNLIIRALAYTKGEANETQNKRD